MTFAELDSRSLLLLSGCFVWIPVTALIFYFIQGMIMGELEVITGLLGVIFAGFLGFLSFNPPDPSLSPYVFVMATVSLVLLPFIRHLVSRHDLAKFQLENVERSYDALRQKSNNLGAQIKLAKALHERGLQAHAAAIVELGLQGLDSKVFSDDFRMLRQWKQHIAPEEYRPLPCLHCDHLNPPGTFFCAGCGRGYLEDYAKGWTSGGLLRKVVAVWVVGVLMIIGIPLISKSAPPNIAIICIPVLVVLAAVLLLSAFRRLTGAP